MQCISACVLQNGLEIKGFTKKAYFKKGLTKKAYCIKGFAKKAYKEKGNVTYISLNCEIYILKKIDFTVKSIFSKTIDFAVQLKFTYAYLANAQNRIIHTLSLQLGAVHLSHDTRRGRGGVWQNIIFYHRG